MSYRHVLTQNFKFSKNSNLIANAWIATTKNLFCIFSMCKKKNATKIVWEDVWVYYLSIFHKQSRQKSTHVSVLLTLPMQAVTDYKNNKHILPPQQFVSCLRWKGDTAGQVFQMFHATKHLVLLANMQWMKYKHNMFCFFVSKHNFTCLLYVVVP